MSKYARILNGTVEEVVSLPDEAKPADCFHPEIPGEWRECDGDVAARWTHDGYDFHAPIFQVSKEQDE